MEVRETRTNAPQKGAQQEKIPCTAGLMRGIDRRMSIPARNPEPSTQNRPCGSSSNRLQMFPLRRQQGPSQRGSTSFLPGGRQAETLPPLHSDSDHGRRKARLPSQRSHRGRSLPAVILDLSIQVVEEPFGQRPKRKEVVAEKVGNRPWPARLSLFA